MSIAIDPEVRAVLVKVRDEILTDESKWAQGDEVFLGRTPTCLGMAIAQAVTDGGRHSSTCNAVRRALGFQPGESVLDWNDAPQRNFADVRGLLDRAIGAE